MPRLAYWDQEDHDKAMHLIQQSRELLLSLDLKANGAPLAQKKVRVYVARSMVEGCEEYHDYLLDENGSLELTQPYKESLIDIELTREALPKKAGIDQLLFHWFHPGKWFDQLSIHRDLTNWITTPFTVSKGDVTVNVSFDATLDPTSAQVNFSNLLGHIFEAPEMGSYPEASVKLSGKGKATFTFHMDAFFEKWAKNYSKPFQVGDEYPLEVLLTFNTRFDVKPSSKQDPAFVPKTYDGRVDQTDGNPYLGVPSTTPEQTVQLVAKDKVILTPEMLTTP
jgi:hypothetical protein